jgi:hypothetical protein
MINKRSGASPHQVTRYLLSHRYGIALPDYSPPNGLIFSPSRLN